MTGSLTRVSRTTIFGKMSVPEGAADRTIYLRVEADRLVLISSGDGLKLAREVIESL